MGSYCGEGDLSEASFLFLSASWPDEKPDASALQPRQLLTSLSISASASSRFLGTDKPSKLDVEKRTSGLLGGCADSVYGPAAFQITG